MLRALLASVLRPLAVRPQPSLLVENRRGLPQGPSASCHKAPVPAHTENPGPSRPVLLCGVMLAPLLQKVRRVLGMFPMLARQLSTQREGRELPATQTEVTFLPHQLWVRPLHQHPLCFPAAQDGSWRRRSQLVCTRATSPWGLCVFARVFSAYPPARMSFLVARAWTASFTPILLSRRARQIRQN